MDSIGLRTISRGWGIGVEMKAASHVDDRARRGIALSCEGSNRDAGRLAKRFGSPWITCLAVVANGSSAIPRVDDRITYGHGYSMLFLSQMLGERGRRRSP